MPEGVPIDLPNVCFAGGTSPDRLTALAGLAELRKIAPTRPWRLIQVTPGVTQVSHVVLGGPQ